MAFLAFLLGACVGSFLNVVIDRAPEGRSLLRPRSACDQCGRALHTAELIPIVSYIALRGRCRTCSNRIPIRVVIVEIATASLFLGLALQHQLDPEFWALAAATALMIAIFFIDWERGLILNSLTYPAAAIALAVSPLWPQLGFDREFLGNGGAFSSFMNSAISGVGAYLGFYLIYMASRGGFGMGDVKMALMMGFIVGYPGIVAATWIGVIAGGVVAIALIAAKIKGRKETIAFGPFLAVGMIVVILSLEWLTREHMREGIGGLLR